MQASKTAPTAADPKEQSEFMARLIQKVISNLLVTSTNIHIRYEDTFSNAEARRSRLNARPAGGGGAGGHAARQTGAITSAACPWRSLSAVAQPPPPATAGDRRDAGRPHRGRDGRHVEGRRTRCGRTGCRVQGARGRTASVAARPAVDRRSQTAAPPVLLPHPRHQLVRLDALALYWETAPELLLAQPVATVMAKLQAAVRSPAPSQNRFVWGECALLLR